MQFITVETRAFNVPLERLRFEPDPLGFNTGLSPCPCLQCRVQRKIAALYGVTPEQQVEITALTPVIGGWPLLEDQKSEAGGQRSEVGKSATEGRRAGETEGESASGVFAAGISLRPAVPPSLCLSVWRRLVRVADRWLLRAIRLLARRRPRLRVVRAEEEGRG